MPDYIATWLPEVGYFCLLLALAAYLLVLARGVRRCFHQGALRGGRPLQGCAIAALLLLLAWALLTLAFVQNDFTLRYVLQQSNRELPLAYRLAAPWGGHEGSLLFWCLCLGLWQTWLTRHLRGGKLQIFTTLFITFAQVGLLLFIVIFSDPFVRQFPAPVDGRDLNAMLQHPALIFHPPLLYLGYAGMQVCCALLLAGLFCRVPGRVLARRCIGSLALAWALLTAGIALGSWWAYSELGWGGWWFWDPVENAALLPWLTGAACLHAVLIMRRSGHLARSAALLAAVSALLALTGTLIVRSGILQSVHAFALDEVRALPLFALFIVLNSAMLWGFAVGARRYRAAPAGTALPSLWLTGGIGTFCAVALVVLVGTLFPMVWSFSGAGKISVGAPYFNRVLLPFGLLAVVLMLAGSRRRNIPMWLAHAGVLLCAIGIASSAWLKTEISVALLPGESVQLDVYRFTLHEGELVTAGNYTAQKMSIDVQRADKQVARLHPERRFYTVRNQRMFEPGIATDGWRDWYALVAQKQGDRYAVRLMVQRGVRFVWFGGGLMALGALAAALSRRSG
ncbi:heme lyase NrfEFG subunit NrfE [Tenebrionicola larvae]|uniref:heme lyase NrfEFG subunit NrfE n=1 Tax=Tenebrionicola larvae TaxID=2815733 RepID=UPI0020127AF6|nr:heme lyase NrfEFG subunit NrfE [Tenebrionicola larvae]